MGNTDVKGGVQERRHKMSMSGLELRVNEVFTSRQGEGPSAGKEATFVRLHKCNLRCVFCDTERALVGEPNMVVTIKQALTMIATSWMSVYGASVNKRLIVTGGEPLLQRLAVVEVAKALRPEWDVEVETNGTIFPEGLEDCQINCSPKLSNAGMRPGARIVPAVLVGIAELPQSIFKFVVNDLDRVKEVEGLVKKVGIGADRIMLMPEGADVETLEQRSPQVKKWANERGWGFSSRLHILGNYR